MSKPIVICIDDEQFVLDSLIREISESLENECDIETALGGAEALELVDELIKDGSEIALVISDYIMPDIKGDEVLRYVHEKLPQTLKIMLTGEATVEGIVNAINSAKLYRYISKPWHKVDLKLTVKEAIKSYVQERKLAEQNKRLIENEQRLRHFLEAMPIGVSVHNALGQLTYANQKSKELFEIAEGTISNIENLPHIYALYQSEHQDLCLSPDLPIARSLSGEIVRTDDLEIHQEKRIVPLEISSTPIRDETGKICYAIATFSDITERKQAEKLRENYNRNLESQVSERTQQLQQKNEELANTLKQLESAQQELIHSEKMAALGQLIAGVAHEINTPLGAIQSSVKYIGDYFSENLAALPTWFRQLTPEKELQFKELLARSLVNPALISGRERRQLRKAIIAQLETQNLSNADTLANLLLDLKIYENIEPLFNLFQDPSSEIFLKKVRSFVRLQESTRDINTASERAAKVVFALKTYARQNLNEQKIKVNIIEGLEAVMTLYQNPIKHGVELIKNYEDLPQIECYFDELNQVWTNLIHNALQAMNYRGILRVDAARLNGNIEVSITDSGSGIPEEIQDKIFQPFFTTKPPGEGSGLGLDIVKKIIEKHGGTIHFRSLPGKTTFIVALPADI
jgi:signal transduction histidine kinase/FixJ family two-component response regulator